MQETKKTTMDLLSMDGNNHVESVDYLYPWLNSKIGNRAHSKKFPPSSLKKALYKSTFVHYPASVPHYSFFHIFKLRNKKALKDMGCH